MNNFDLVIIGAGCSGASGAMYASRMNLRTLMIGEMPGGLITTTHLVENWPGIKAISGPDLAYALVDHAVSFGVEMKNEYVKEIQPIALTQAEIDDGWKSGFKVITASGEYVSKTVLVATGTKHRHMDVPGEVEFANKGVSYCALCDGAFFKGKTVCVVGGSDSAAKEALLLAEHASKVYVFARSTLHPEPINLERVKANMKIEVREGTKVREIKGVNKVEKVVLESGEEIAMDAVFVAIGHIPLSDLVLSLGVDLNDKKEIKINRQAETNVPGIFAAGDVCDTKFKQAITGSAEAVTAAYFAFEYIQGNKIKI